MINYTSKEINKIICDIQEKWANSIIEIGKAYLDKKDYFNLMEKFLDDLYYFKQGKVLFKPTKASHKQFRNKRNEFISYFIGHNKVSDEDKGFALEPWKNINFQNFDFITYDDIIISMGNYLFTDYENKKTKVEYSFGYMFDQENKLRIIFHHSSIPYKQ
tara:strand:+ start:263 stop:742 length:480 start_codon:yes stop_codon:yes gene_type:complete